MKKIIILMVTVFALLSGIIAQNVDDALRYSQLFYGGTARFMSMGGAFTALGADISSLSQNPAGLGVFRASELTVTPQLNYANTSASFNGISTEYLNNFNLNQAGLVANIISNPGSSGLRTLNFGYSFNKTNNLNQNIRIQGINNTSSISDSWALNSEGIPYYSLTGAEGIAYEAWVIDTLTGSGGESYGTVFSNYGDNFPSVYGQNMRRIVSTEGYTGEHALSIGGNYSDKLFFGLTFGINTIRYTSYYDHLESTEKKLPSQISSFTYTDYFDNRGTGYNFKIGAIYRPIEILRIGLAFHSPTWYKIDEYFYDNVASRFTDGDNYSISNDPLRYNYALATPFRFMAGAALQIKKFGIISADYEFIDYTAARFSETGDGYNYSDKNRNISNSLQATSNFRVGGEFRISKFYLRSGYGYYGKPFRPGEDNEELDYRSISGGVGFREQNFSIDFAYTNLAYTQKYILYPLDNSFDAAVSNIHTDKNMFTLTLGYKFGY